MTGARFQGYAPGAIHASRVNASSSRGARVAGTVTFEKYPSKASAVPETPRFHRLLWPSADSHVGELIRPIEATRRGTVTTDRGKVWYQFQAIGCLPGGSVAELAGEDESSVLFGEIHHDVRERA